MSCNSLVFHLFLPFYYFDQCLSHFISPVSKGELMTIFWPEESSRVRTVLTRPKAALWNFYLYPSSPPTDSFPLKSFCFSQLSDLPLICLI